MELILVSSLLSVNFKENDFICQFIYKIDLRQESLQQSINIDLICQFLLLEEKKKNVTLYFNCSPKGS